jgi:hypothetical protein
MDCTESFGLFLESRFLGRIESFRCAPAGVPLSVCNVVCNVVQQIPKNATPTDLEQRVRKRAADQDDSEPY